jgi:hypothetical protein
VSGGWEQLYEENRPALGDDIDPDHLTAGIILTVD